MSLNVIFQILKFLLPYLSWVTQEAKFHFFKSSKGQCLVAFRIKEKEIGLHHCGLCSGLAG